MFLLSSRGIELWLQKSIMLSCHIDLLVISWCQHLFDQNQGILNRTCLVTKMASLDSMVHDWDAIPEVRTRMREQRTLFVKEDGKDKPEATISCGELNFHVLKPLVEKLEVSPGALGMHSVPHLQKQILD